MVTSHAGYMILRLRRYPAWRVTVNGRIATNLSRRGDGLTVVPVPEGPVELKADWTTTGDVILGRVLRVLVLLLLGALWLVERRICRRRIS